jgi:hypothetical protein
VACPLTGHFFNFTHPLNYPILLFAKFLSMGITGKVITLVADRPGVFIELDNDPSIGPKNNVWLLKEDHRNFNALYSLALAAAANRWPLTIRIEGNSQIDPLVDAAIKTVGVAWKAGDFNVD